MSYFASYTLLCSAESFILHAYVMASWKASAFIERSTYVSTPR